MLKRVRHFMKKMGVEYLFYCTSEVHQNVFLRVLPADKMQTCSQRDSSLRFFVSRGVSPEVPDCHPDL
jgi:hypothetical protein